MKILPIAAAFLLCVLRAGAFAQQTIHVSFVDNATKQLFATDEISADKLPAQFTANITIDIKGEKWIVLGADPPAKADFIQTGKLSLLLARADKAAPASAAMSSLFQIPTVAGDIGDATGRTPPGPGIFSIRHDDWRQVEFVSINFMKEIDAEFADIHKNRATRQPGGYPDMFVRERIPAPIHDCTLRDARDMLPQVAKFDAVGFQRQAGTLPHSFAWQVDATLVVWGTTDDDGNIVQLCLAGAPGRDDAALVSDALSKFTLRHDLYLVDWCNETRVSGSVLDFEKYFGVRQ